MLKSILLGLDDTPASVRAQETALSLAQTHGARLTGMTVIDAARISPPEPVPMGADSYKLHKDAVLINRTREKLAALARRFADRCRAALLDCDVSVTEGDAIAALVTASEVHDLIVIGRDTVFHAEPGGKVSEIVERLLRCNPRPLLVVPEEERDAQRVLIAYDGSVPAMRALQMLSLLGMANGGEVTLANISTRRADGETLCARAARYLASHGISARARSIETQSDPATVLSEIAAELNAGLIVMGAYGQRGWREYLLGSTTDKLLAAAKSPLFIYH